jgi:hypothetical protein
MTIKKSASSTIKKLYGKAYQNYSAKIAGSRSLLYNKYVLYVSFAICLLNLMIWMFSGEFVHVGIFLLVGFLTSYFSKNMIVILVIAFVVSNVVKSGSNIVLEGMANESEDSKEKAGEDETKEGNDEVYNKKPAKEGVSNSEKEEVEGIDESAEGIDDMPCTTDTDCTNGYKCNDKFVCVAP